MYRRILVPLDGSELAEQVLPWAETLAKGTHAQIGLLRVIAPVPEEITNPARGLYAHRIADSMGSHARDYLERLAVPLRDRGLQVSCAVREGHPASSIISEGDRHQDTLIAMTTHGRSGMGRWLLGSVTTRVLHASPCPVLVVRASETESPPPGAVLETIVLPLDGSPLAEQALEHAAPLAEALGLQVLLVRAIPSRGEYHQYFERHPVSSSATIYTRMYEEFSREADARAMEYLHNVRQRLSDQKVTMVEERLLRGHAAEAIVDLAHQTPNSLVAMTTHGRSGVARWVLGSVTDRVVRHSGVPVLVVRAAPQESQASE